MKKILNIVDGYGYVFRAFYAVPPLTNAQNQPVGAVFGFCRMLLNLMAQKKDEYFFVALDTGKKTKKHDVYPDYKKNRKETPVELRQQFPMIRDACDALGIPHIEVIGFEADDVIASYTQHALEHDYEVVVISADKDLMQLMQPSVRLWDPIKNKAITQETVLEKFGVSPEQVLEVQALMGDSSDNIPGIPGFGPKTAAQFIQEYGTLENIYDNLDAMPASKKKDKLIAHKDSAFLSKKLATLDLNVPIQKPLNHLQISNTLEQAKQFMDTHGFQSLYRKIEALHADTQTVVKSVTGSAFVQKAQQATAFSVDVTDDGFVCYMPYVQAHTGCLDDSLMRNPYVSKIFWDMRKLVQDPRHCGEIQNYHDISVLTLSTNLGKPFQLAENTLQAQAIYETFSALFQEAYQKQTIHLYYKIDRPLIALLRKIENYGIKLDLDYLETLKHEFEQNLATLEKQIYTLVGTTFNINSPKQLSHILFEKYQMPYGVKTKSGAYSTDSDVLEKLDKAGFELPALILQWRLFMKLNGTYVLPLLAKHTDGRIHTTLSQTITNTGRLASSDPNLQNIPVKTPEGRKIRKAFIGSTAQHRILSFDYSQIELRLLAHYAQEPELLEAFRQDKDIHAITAQHLFQNPDVTSQTRRLAKTINFGIIYGMSAHGLAEALSVSREDAQSFIHKYFERYPKIKTYIQEQIQKAKHLGYVETLTRRRIYIKDIHAPNRNVQQFAERQSVNAPLQGSNADIIKMAMLKIDHMITTQKLETCMILQVHDELLFDTPLKELEHVQPHIQQIMEDIVTLSVPLKVNVGAGQSWLDAMKA